MQFPWESQPELLSCTSQQFFELCKEFAGPAPRRNHQKILDLGPLLMDQDLVPLGVGSLLKLLNGGIA